LASEGVLERALSCAVLSPGLRSVLLEDLEEAELEEVASRAKALLEAIGAKVERVHLGGAAGDDQIWGTLAPIRGSTGVSVRWRPGILVPSAGQAVRLVIVPDLSGLGPAAQRACIAAVGADVVHVARRGWEETYTPRYFWLAACAREQIDTLSRHLLDRFALQLPRFFSTDACVQRLGRALAGAVGDDPVAAELAAASKRKPRVSEQALAALAEASTPTTRSAVSLARLAYAEAQLQNVEELSAEQVVHALALRSGRLASSKGERAEQPPENPSPSPTPERPLPEMPATAQPGARSFMRRRPRAQEEFLRHEPVIETSAGIEPERPSLPPASPASAGPLDTLDVFAARPALQRWFGKKAARGRIVGVEPARGRAELALTATVLEAAKLRRWRALTDSSERLEIRVQDLRVYRRLPGPEHFLVVVLDHTALERCNWRGALNPYLRRAYQDRSAFCLVQVGAARQLEAEELRANRIVGRTLLAPHLADAIERAPARATPLAHGLALAHEALIRSLLLRPNRESRTTLVVMTDGRGNVPLAASYEGRISARVADQGVTDSLVVARRIATLGVEVVLIDTRPEHGRDLPERLAAALGASRRVAREPPIEAGK
jgi:magnesium chelatase subunit D